MFEKASRLKIRFNYRGQCSVEDLWDLPLKALDEIYKGMVHTQKARQEDSLLEDKSKEDTMLELGIEIVRHIVTVRLAEKKANEESKLRASQKEKILSIIADKQDEALKGKSIEELMALADKV